jgi:hypothetical protein
LLDGFLIFALTAALIWPLFKTKYLASWGSIDSTFVADARFLQQEWPHPRWQPLWYCGTRFDYIYPPALRYGSAGLARLFHLIPARGYHLYTAILYCLGVSGVYLLIRTGSGSRGAAWLGAAAMALLSPSYLFIADVRRDARLVQFAPDRLNVLVRYGEGPHMSAVALLPFALAAAWLGLQRRWSAALSVSALFCALVVSNNFYGATALAIFFPPLVWALWLALGGGAVWIRAALLAALAYGLTAFWLVPSYFRITTENLRIVSQEGNRWSIWVALAAVALYGFITWKVARGRPERAYPVFVWGMFAFMTLNVLGNQWWQFRVAGEPSRLIPELDFAMLLLAVEGLRWWWNRARRLRAAIAVAVILCFVPAAEYLRHAHHVIVRDANYQNRIEYQLTKWISEHLPDARSLATGSVRFWYDGWFNLAQIGGGSEQGMLNYASYEVQWQITGEAGAEASTLWMQALGGDAIIVHFKNSRELYHDYTKPEKFAGKLPVIYDDGAGNVIYRVPRRFPDRARVVESARIRNLPLLVKNFDALRPYVSAIEEGPDRRAYLTREGTDAMRIRAPLQAGDSIVVQESWDPAWRAYAGAQPLPVRKDAAGFMEIMAPPGEQEIRLVFELPLENQIGRALSILSAVILLIWAARSRMLPAAGA